MSNDRQAQHCNRDKMPVSEIVRRLERDEEDRGRPYRRRGGVRSPWATVNQQNRQAIEESLLEQPSRHVGLEARLDFPRNEIRDELTRRGLMDEGTYHELGPQFSFEVSRLVSRPEEARRVSYGPPSARGEPAGPRRSEWGWGWDRLAIATEEWLYSMRRAQRRASARKAAAVTVALPGYQPPRHRESLQWLREVLGRWVGLRDRYIAEREVRRRRAEIGLPPPCNQPATESLRIYVETKRNAECEELAEKILRVSHRQVAKPTPLTKAEKRSLVLEAIALDPEQNRSDRDIAREAGVSPTTVGKIRRELDT